MCSAVSAASRGDNAKRDCLSPAELRIAQSHCVPLTSVASMRITLLVSSLVFTLFGTLAAAGPERFDGRLVHEADGTPVAGAMVSIVGASGSVRTDEDGRFDWVPAPAVPFQLIIVLSGGQV